MEEINNIKHHLDVDDLFDLKEILEDNENEIKIESGKEEDKIIIEIILLMIIKIRI